MSIRFSEQKKLTTELYGWTPRYSNGYLNISDPKNFQGIAFEVMCGTNLVEAEAEHSRRVCSDFPGIESEFQPSAEMIKSSLSGQSSTPDKVREEDEDEEGSDGKEKNNEDSDWLVVNEEEPEQKVL